MSRIIAQRLFALVAAAVFLTACQGTVNHGSSAQIQAISRQLPTECSVDINNFRNLVNSEGAANAGSLALPNYPLLHSNRFFHALSRHVESNSEVLQWASLLAELAIDTRATENENLVAPWSESSLERLAICSRDFATASGSSEARAALLAITQQSAFPENYQKPKQVLGALFLLRPFLRQRILALHVNERTAFLEEEPFSASNSYTLDADTAHVSPNDVSDWFNSAYASNALALPLLEDAQLEALFAAHAPALVVEREDIYDSIGSPEWEGDRVRIQTDKPAVYTLPSMTLFEGRKLLQLNYVFWFPERRRKALIDLYSGNVDSIIWRITFDEQGQVLLYDSIHSCGCYQKFFVASDKVVAKLKPDSREPANIFRLDESTVHDGLRLTLTANEHYIVGVDSDSLNPQSELRRYTLKPYEQLYNLGNADRTKNLFNDQGLIEDSVRLERYTLWPTGILSVGAMRQWGTHATGFIEEQHFDEANLIERYFESASRSQ